MVYTLISQLVYKSYCSLCNQNFFYMILKLNQSRLSSSWLLACFSGVPCGELVWAYQAATQLLSSTGQGDSCIEVQTETSLTSYYHGQNTLSWGKKINFITIKIEQDNEATVVKCSHQVLLHWISDLAERHNIY